MKVLYLGKNKEAPIKTRTIFLKFALLNDYGRILRCTF